MRHFKNLLFVIAGTAVSAALVGLAFLLLSLFLPNVMCELGAQNDIPNPVRGREVFLAIGLAFGAVFGVGFMLLSLAAEGIRSLSKNCKSKTG